MSGERDIRIDKFLWAVRIYKTRSIASEECRKGRILVGTIPAKPSRNVAAGEIILVRKPPVTFTYKIKDPIQNRVAARLVPDFLEDLTPEEELKKLDIRQPLPGGYRPRGTGRPTKKERRLIDRLREDTGDQEQW